MTGIPVRDSLLTRRLVRRYTPDVFDSFQVLDWSEQIGSAIANGAAIDNYWELSMSSKYVVYVNFGPFGSAIIKTVYGFSCRSELPLGRFSTDYLKCSLRDVSQITANAL